MTIPRRDLIWLALVGLLFQAVWAVRTPQPTYMDAYYYTTNGQRLAAGFGFTEEVIWQFLDEPAGLPTPSHTYWMPFTSLLAATGYQLGDSFRAAQLPFWLLAGLLPVLAYLISWTLQPVRNGAWLAALLTASGGFYNNFFNQPATFAPFAWAGGGCLLLLVWGQQDGRFRFWLLAGVLAGVAHLTRADGLLLLVVGLAAAGYTALVPRPVQWRKLWVWSASLLLGYLLLMGGWFVHNWQTHGQLLPGVGTQTIFLTTYDDLFAYGRFFSLADFLAWGWGNILQSKLVGLSLAAQTFLAVSCLIFLCPFVLWAWYRLGWRERERGNLRPFTFYLLALFGSMAFLFTLPGARGGLFHSSAAIWPWCMALAAVGIGDAIQWRMGRWPHPNPAQGARIYQGLAVVVAFVMGIALGMRPADRQEAAVFAEVGRLLPPAAIVMTGNPPGFYYHTGRAAVTIPNEPLQTVLDAVAYYQVTHLLIDSNHPLPLADFYQEDETSAVLEKLFERDGYKLYRVETAVAP